MSESKIETPSVPVVENQTNNDKQPEKMEVDAQNEESSPEPKKGRRSSAGRPKISRIMKDVEEGQALLKEMGHTVDGADEGRRRTRSSTRGGPPPPTPPPVKRERKSASTSNATNSTEKVKSVPKAPPASQGKNRGRGRPKRQDVGKSDSVSDEEKVESEPQKNEDNDECIDTKEITKKDKEEPPADKVDKVDSAPAVVKPIEKESSPKRVNAEKIEKRNDISPEKKNDVAEIKQVAVEKKVEVKKVEENKINNASPEKKDNLELPKKPEVQTARSTPPPPSVSEKPKVIEKPQVVEKPKVIEKPVVVEKPKVVEKPPVAVEKPSLPPAQPVDAPPSSKVSAAEIPKAPETPHKNESLLANNSNKPGEVPTANQTHKE